MLEPTIALIGLILSAFFSGSEMAFIQANALQIEVWRKQGRRIATITSNLLASPERYLTTVLVGTNIANVLTSSYAAIALLRFDISKTWTVLIITVTILFWGEIVPKVLVRDHATSLAVGVTPLIRFFETLLAPFVKLVKSYSRLITSAEKGSASILTREDLKLLFEEVETGEEFEEEEKEVITNIFEFGARPARMAMTPRSDITAVSSKSTLEEVAKVFMDTGFSKLPVYGDNLDDILGVAFLHDLFTSPSAIEDIVKSPLIVSESMPANEALQMLKRHKSSIAIVQDASGKTAGLITVEDLIEELFGEFEDVFDDTGRKVNRLADGNLIVDSLVEVQDLNRLHGFKIPEGNYETIGGFILSKVGRIPDDGETLDFSAFRIKVLKKTSNRLERLHIIKKR